MNRPSSQARSARESEGAPALRVDALAKPATGCRAQLGSCAYPSCRCNLPLTGAITVMTTRQRTPN